jgi:hypothetical protein
LFGVLDRPSWYLTMMMIGKYDFIDETFEDFQVMKELEACLKPKNDDEKSQYSI